ncbi:MAG: 2,3-bisphosphoglycerate-independent phosphoglycerate mutase [Anaerolineales bacterium]|nr:2,3-bisphosphoglycerate-independent phosphoglycerate mutase [Anaerolineales bacterium]
MANFDLMKELHIAAETKIVMLVIDGLGGLPMEPGGPTELEAARTPNLDALAVESICGLSAPIAPGVTPGSGPAHLALFGYDPLRYEIGRGVLEACGIGFPLGPNDVAARGNFCTVDENGLVADRRAGRIPTEKGAELCQVLRAIQLPGVETFVEPVRDYRFVVVLRGEGLSGGLTETDPQQLGVPPRSVEALVPEAQRTAELLNQWIAEARELLADQHPANMVLLRGPDKTPLLPGMAEVYGLRAAAIAVYPMYRGVARLLGMDILETGETLEEEVETLKTHWEEYDFFFVHVKKTDSAGEDGDFALKASVIEHVDEAMVPAITSLEPDVFIVTGDHSTPALLKSHSWHPVPTLLHSKYCRPDEIRTFGERACMRGGLGVFPATDLMWLAMANALRLTKFGA